MSRVDTNVIYVGVTTGGIALLGVDCGKAVCVMCSFDLI